MLTLKKCPMFMPLLLVTACVTINVYFPAAAAESAADKIIQGIYGEDGTEPAVDDVNTEPQGSADQAQTNFLVRLLQSVIPAAEAQQPDLDIATPGINKLQSLMRQRHRQLSAYYDSGAVGMDASGLITIRDGKAIALKERNQVRKLVIDENRDRNRLYQEIAVANGHPEWETDIRKTFARRWIANAPAGWWYQGANGNWQKK